MDNLNRLDAIKDDNSGSPGDTLACYTYLGLNDVVIEDLEEPDVKLDYFGGTSGTYSGFDDFDRVVDQRWYDYGASADRDRFKYGYDRASNRVWKENVVAAGNGKDFDEFYAYDGMRRLESFDRGDLNANKDGITGTPGREQDWGLDATGNWTSLVQKTSGTTDLDQDRAHNRANEITQITATTGTNWADPVHDRSGNMTTLPKPSDLANTLTCKYDAWNRLVEVKDGQTVVGKYEYDGLNRRVKKHLDSQSPGDPDDIDSYVHYFYNSAWQVLETRETTTESAQAEILQPKYQYLWSPRYIDAAILRDENTDQDGLCDDGRIYYLNDANFNVTCLTDTGGDAIERYVYDPYGTVTIYDATWSSTRSISSYDNTVLYTGRDFDPETSLYDYRNRYYGCRLARFVSRDPVAYDDGPNLYQYVHGNPVSNLDLSGTATITARKGVKWMVAGVIPSSYTLFGQNRMYIRLTGVTSDNCKFDRWNWITRVWKRWLWSKTSTSVGPIRSARKNVNCPCEKMDCLTYSSTGVWVGKKGVSVISITMILTSKLVVTICADGTTDAGGTHSVQSTWGIYEDDFNARSWDEREEED